MKKLSSGYIMSIVMSVLLLLEVIGVKVDVPYVNEVTMAVLGVLIALGVVEGVKDSDKKKPSDGEVSKKYEKTDMESINDDSLHEKVSEAVEDITDTIEDILPKDKE